MRFIRENMQKLGVGLGLGLVAISILTGLWSLLPLLIIGGAVSVVTYLVSPPAGVFVGAIISTVVVVALAVHALPMLVVGGCIAAGAVAYDSGRKHLAALFGVILVVALFLGTLPAIALLVVAVVIIRCR